MQTTFSSVGLILLKYAIWHLMQTTCFSLFRHQSQTGFNQTASLICPLLTSSALNIECPEQFASCTRSFCLLPAQSQSKQITRSQNMPHKHKIGFYFSLSRISLFLAYWIWLIFNEIQRTEKKIVIGNCMLLSCYWKVNYILYFIWFFSYLISKIRQTRTRILLLL